MLGYVSNVISFVNSTVGKRTGNKDRLLSFDINRCLGIFELMLKRQRT